ncbi:hypothetical protein [Pseudomonas sp. M5]|uniref:hypothetical protein n=1 Tax=Pseudomonas sp. M5 TaxID=1620788 RepID=UPI00195D25E6|nr:hypothetical protein [Pseudomonas sp. M5]MBM7397250.1 hypothetical protein [Pseudomonas sp. M5]HDS1756977.1 hypothetical protein [Pseudomonas putida]
MTKSIKPVINTAVSPRTQALLGALRTGITLGRLDVPELTAPVVPQNYVDVKSGLNRMAERFIDPARAEGKRTSADDVARELGAVIAQAARSGMPLADLPAALDYDAAMLQHRGQQAHYLRSSDEHAARLAADIQTWLADLLAVLKVREALGADVVQDAAGAGNKTMAATALDLVAREKLNTAGAADLPVMAAGRGLMVLLAAGVDPAELELTDLEVLVALAGVEIIPAILPGAGLAAADLSFRAGTSLVKVTTRGAVLYREAETQGGRVVLPHSVLVAVSQEALEQLQAEVGERLARVPHRFQEAAVGNSSLDRSRRVIQGGGLNAFAASIG